MSDDKKVKPADDAFDLGPAATSDSASRARNKTVMLTPEMTGQVRARLSRVEPPRSSAPTGSSIADLGARNSSPISRQVIEQEIQSYEVKQIEHDAPPVDDYQSFQSFSGEQPVEQHPAQPVGQSERKSTEVEPRYLNVPEDKPVQYHEKTEIIKTTITTHEEPVMATGNRIIWTKKSVIIGALISYDQDALGELYELRTGRLVVSSAEQAGSNTLVLIDETVSTNHAIMRIGDQGDIQILDQLSEYGTDVIKKDGEELRLAGDKATVAHGDIIKFGNRSFKVCLVG